MDESIVCGGVHYDLTDENRGLSDSASPHAEPFEDRGHPGREEGVAHDVHAIAVDHQVEPIRSK